MSLPAIPKPVRVVLGKVAIASRAAAVVHIHYVAAIANHRERALYIIDLSVYLLRQAVA